MKTLKQALSLTLTAALLAGALVLPAGAEEAVTFTDASEIRHWTAVETMARLGIVNGKDDGSFAPAGQVTRAEAAKLLAMMLAGGQEEKLVLGEEAPTFTDIQEHWAKDYITFCVQQGVVAGRSEEIFDPNGQVTCGELAKMALVALGYEPTVFALTGADWEISTNVYANQPNVDLYAGLKDEIDPFAPATREQAAQILCNALNAAVMAAVPVQPDEETGAEPVTSYAPKTDEAGNPVTFLMEHFAPSQEEVPEA